jgi:hypothetical protein
MQCTSIPESGLKMAFVDFAALSTKIGEEKEEEKSHCYATFLAFAEAE